jgi:hypothetical protein
MHEFDVPQFQNFEAELVGVVLNEDDARYSGIRDKLRARKARTCSCVDVIGAFEVSALKNRVLLCVHSKAP